MVTDVAVATTNHEIEIGPGKPRVVVKPTFLSLITTEVVHCDVVKWEHFPRYCPFVRGTRDRHLTWPYHPVPPVTTPLSSWQLTVFGDEFVMGWNRGFKNVCGDCGENWCKTWFGIMIYVFLHEEKHFKSYAHVCLLLEFEGFVQISHLLAMA